MLALARRIRESAEAARSELARGFTATARLHAYSAGVTEVALAAAQNRDTVNPLLADGEPLARWAGEGMRSAQVPAASSAPVNRADHAPVVRSSRWRGGSTHAARCLGREDGGRDEE